MTQNQTASGNPDRGGFGLTTAVFVVVSSMVGVGILTTSGHTVAEVGSNQLMLWLWAFGGIVALCGALTVAELGAMLPRSGGEYVFVREAFGPRWAFMVGWATLWVGFAAPIAASASAASAYLLSPWNLDASVAGVARKLTAFTLIVGFAAVHSLGQKHTERAQGAVTLLGLLLLVGFVVAGVFSPGIDPRRLDDRPELSADLVGRAFFSLVYVYYGYTGWNGSAYIAGEVRSGEKTLPLSIMIGTVLVTLLYLAINFVYAAAIPASEILELVRESGGQEVVDPIAEITARRLWGPAWASRFSTAVGMILIASVSSYILTGSRVLRAMAESGDFPPFASRLSGRTGTPVIALGIMAAWSVLLLFSGSFNAIVVFAGVGLAEISLLWLSSVYVLRVRRPDLPRPFRTPGYPWVPAIALIGTVSLIVAAFIEAFWLSVAVTVLLPASLPLYDLRRKLASLGGSSPGA